MKKILFFTLSIALSLNISAQTEKIVLKKNQLLKLATTLKGTTSIDAITQSMDITTSSSASKNILVTDVSKDKYAIDFTTTKLKLAFNMMGTEKSFDSENNADSANELKDLTKNINVPFKLSLYKDGSVELTDTTTKNALAPIAKDDLLSGILGQAMSANIGEPAAVENCFMLLPNNKKVGDTWSDSTINQDNRISNSYTWDNTESDIATIKIISKISSKIKTQMPEFGIDLDATINNTVNEVRKVDLKTGIIQQKNVTTVIDGSADMLGMSLPITGTTESTSTIEVQ
ncbi:DUF6263 family protein [Ferruginibacter sp. SUN002]|uniref:DUF6263 family protein n=1 Tax=Ferruginibacter sp. SUN002 TaxID=2937789 RepID=UPI003D35F700